MKRTITLEDYKLMVVFFFFQAEDGIRDLTVTGVQTCALPISFRAIFVQDTVAITLATGGRIPSPESVRSIGDRKSTRLNSSHSQISYAVFCLKKKKLSWSIILLFAIFTWQGP